MVVAEVVVLVVEDNSVEEVEDDTHVAEAPEDTQVVEAAEDHQEVAVAVAAGREVLIVINNITLLLSHNLSFSSFLFLPPMKREKKQKGKRKFTWLWRVGVLGNSLIAHAASGRVLRQ